MSCATCRKSDLISWSGKHMSCSEMNQPTHQPSTRSSSPALPIFLCTEAPHGLLNQHRDLLWYKKCLSGLAPFEATVIGPPWPAHIPKGPKGPKTKLLPGANRLGGSKQPGQWEGHTQSRRLAVMAIQATRSEALNVGRGEWRPMAKIWPWFGHDFLPFLSHL